MDVTTDSWESSWNQILDLQFSRLKSNLWKAFLLWKKKLEDKYHLTTRLSSVTELSGKEIDA